MRRNAAARRGAAVDAGGAELAARWAGPCLSPCADSAAGALEDQGESSRFHADHDAAAIARRQCPRADRSDGGEPRRRQHRPGAAHRARARRGRRRPPVHRPCPGRALYPRAARRAGHGRRVPAVRACRRHSAHVRPGGREPAAQGRGRSRQRGHPGHRRERARALCQCRLSPPGRGRRVRTTCVRSSASSSAIPAFRKRSIAC